MKKNCLIILNLCVVIFASCQYRRDSKDLCVDFCKLNKGSSFKILFETSTSESRFKDNTPLEIGVNCPKIKGGTITISIKKELETKKTFGSEYFFDCKNNGIEDSVFLQNYINTFLSEYRNINLPSSFPFRNIRTDSNPKQGRFIAFILSSESTVYYVEDYKQVSSYWRSQFDGMEKFDENWYYKCSN